MSRAAALITPKAAARAALFYDEHPDAYAYAVDYCERLAGKRNDKEPQDVAAVAAAIVPAFVREGREDDKAALRSAARRAVKRAAAAVAQDQDEATPYEIGEDESRTILTTYAPDPAAAYAVRSLDLTAQALLHLDDEEQREAMRLAAIGIRHGAAALTSRAMPRTMQRRISAAVADLRSLQPRILADPYGDGSGNANRGDWEGGDRTRTGSDLPPAAQPSRATLAALRSAAQEAAETRDRLRVQVALAQMENAPEDALRATVEAWQNAAREATRTTAGLAAAETHAARSARRTGAAPQGITTDPAALSPYERPRHYVPKAERPAQVPEWTFSGGTPAP